MSYPGALAVVTGMGCLCAAGENIERCIQSMFEGQVNARTPQRFRETSGLSYPVFEAGDDLWGRLRSDVAPTLALAERCALDCIADAGLDLQELRSQRVGICLGSTTGASLNFIDFHADSKKGLHPDLSALKTYLSGNPALGLARLLGLKGPVQTVVNACSSGTDAIGIAASWIASGLCDMALAGGADALNPVPYYGFISLMITDSSVCRPFDRHRNGLNLGEGAAMLLLTGNKPGERHPSAKGCVLGYASATDAYHPVSPHPEGRGLKKALNRLIAFGQIDLRELSFFNVHGTGTQDNDRIEAAVSGQLLPGIRLSATKGYTGHTLGAAGAIEAALSLSFLDLGRIPASAGLTEPDPEFSVFPVMENTPVDGCIAFSGSLAFGGLNSVIALGKGVPA